MAAGALVFLVDGVAARAAWAWWREAAFGLAITSTVLCVFGLPGAKIGILANLLLLVYLAAANLGWLWRLPATPVRNSLLTDTHGAW